MRDLDNPASRILLKQISRLRVSDGNILAFGVLRTQDVGDGLNWAVAAVSDILLAVGDGVVLIGPEVDPRNVTDVNSGARAVSRRENAAG